MKRSYGFRTFRILQLALYHSLGKLPEPELTHEFFWRFQNKNGSSLSTGATSLPRVHLTSYNQGRMNGENTLRGHVTPAKHPAIAAWPHVLMPGAAYAIRHWRNS